MIQQDASSKRRAPAKRRQEVTSEILDRQPPCNIEAEYGVLGSMLINPECCDEVLLKLSTADFYDDLNATAFSTMEEMWNAGRAIDVTTLHEQLRRRMEADNHPQASGGAAVLLARITNAVPNAAHAVHYASIVREKSVLRSLINSATEILRDAYDGTSDSSALASEAEQKIFSIQERTVSEPQAATDVMVAAFDALDRRMKGETVAGVMTGFGSIDGMLGGLRPSELIILAARPGMGKTGLAMNIVERVVLEQQKKCLFISIEMSAMQLMDRMLSSLARVRGDKMRAGTVSQAELQKLVEAQDRLFNIPFWIDDNANLKVSQIATKARRIKRKHGLDLLVIDYLQLLQPDDARAPREQQVAEMSRQLKQVSKSVGVPVLCLAQLNRQAEQSSDHRPKLSHLRESGGIENDADVVMFIHRPEYYLTHDEREKRKAEGDEVIGLAEIIIAKQRNGPVGDVKLAWQDKFTRFEERAPERHSEFDDFNSGRRDYD